jgi:5-methylcytosine-specific restriction endonuclease McrA
MIRPGQKQPRLLLEAKAYDHLRRQVLERDGWRCQHCGRATNLEVHQIRWRSRLGDDARENLISLCTDCHKTIYSGKRYVSLRQPELRDATTLPE